MPGRKVCVVSRAAAKKERKKVHIPLLKADWIIGRALKATPGSTTVYC